MTSLPPPAALTAHQPPALLVAQVAQLSATGGVVLLEPHAGLEPLQLLEAAAQAIAVLRGAAARGQPGGRPTAGMLVALRDCVVHRAAQPHEPVQVQTERLQDLGALSLHRVRVQVGETVLLEGELTVADGHGAAPAGTP